MSGTTIQVGGTGIAFSVSRFLIDDFEGYSSGDVGAVASPPWTAHASTSWADVGYDGAGNKALSFGQTGLQGTSRDMPIDGQIDDSKTATFFFRFNSKTDDPDHNFGLADMATTSGVDFADFEAQVRVVDDPNASRTFMLDARDGGTFTVDPLAIGLALNTWYNVWMVVNQTTDTYDVYMNIGTGNANAGDKLNSSPLNFRNGTTATLNKILGLANSAPIANGVLYDSLYFLDGINLANPLGGPDSVLAGTGDRLAVDGDLTLDAGALLQLDIVTPTIHDSLDVGGHLRLNGTVEVALATGAPAPQLGDVFDILDFASADGTFTLNLPSLSSGLFWNTNELLATGTLAVVAGIAGDYNGDGIVDAADYTVWRNNLGAPAGTLLNDIDGGVIGQAQYGTWKVNFGRSSDVGSLSNAVVPEPTSGRLLILTAACVALGSANRRGTTR